MDVNYTGINEKKKMKKHAAVLSCSVGVFMLVSLFISYTARAFYSDIFAFITAGSDVFAEAVSYVFGVSRTESTEIVREFLNSGVLYEIFTLISMVVSGFLPAYVLSKVWNFDISDCFVTKGKLVKGAVFVYAFCRLVMIFMSNIAYGMWSFLFPAASDAAMTSQELYPDNIYVLAISFLCSCILVPVIEEYIFRGVVLGIFRKIGTGFAIVASAVCFGLMHGSVLQCMYAVSFGLFSAMLVVVTGNIKTSVLFHAINNTVSFLSVIISSRFGQGAGDAFDNIHGLYILSFSFYGMYLFFSGDGILSALREKTAVDTESEGNAKLSILFSLPFIIFVALFAAKCVSGAV